MFTALFPLLYFSKTRRSIVNPSCITPLNRWFLWIILVWVTIGLCILLSITYFGAYSSHEDPFFFIKKQVYWTCLGVLWCVPFSFFSRRDLYYLSIAGVVSNLITLNLSILYGYCINGARRWFVFGPLLYQPSEVIKPFFCVYMGHELSNWKYLSV